MSGAAPSIPWSRWLDRYAIWIVLVVLFAVAAMLSEAFLRPVYLFNVVRQVAPVGIAAIGVTLVMVLGGLLAGLLYDATGGYQLSFALSCWEVLGLPA